jgi:ankyrin repeat protein
MKQPFLAAIIIGSPLFVASCGDDEPAAPPVESEVASAVVPPAGPVPAPEPVPEPEPAPSQTQLDKDLFNALVFKKADQALAAIQNGADPHAKNRDGLPVIFVAAGAGNSEAVKALIAAGADPNASIGTSFNQDGVGYSGTADGTVLGYAAAKGHGQVMYDLAKAGADLNGSGPNGTTPLMQAVEAGKFPIVKWLIDAGADPNIRNKTGGTALGVAQMIINPDPERQKIIDLLKSRTR